MEVDLKEVALEEVSLQMMLLEVVESGCSDERKSQTILRSLLWLFLMQSKLLSFRQIQTKFREDRNNVGK